MAKLERICPNTDCSFINEESSQCYACGFNEPKAICDRENAEAIQKLKEQLEQTEEGVHFAIEQAIQ